MHLFGFIIRIFHDARSPERQIIHPQEELNMQFYGISCGVSCFCLHVLLCHITALVFVHFFFYVLVLIYLFCLLGISKICFFEMCVVIYLCVKNRQSSHFLH